MPVMVWLPEDEEEPAAVLCEAARLAGRLRVGLCVLHVGRPAGRSLADAAGASSWFISGAARREALERFARAQRAVRVVVGAAGRRRWGNIS